MALDCFADIDYRGINCFQFYVLKNQFIFYSVTQNQKIKEKEKEKSFCWERAMERNGGVERRPPLFNYLEKGETSNTPPFANTFC